MPYKSAPGFHQRLREAMAVNGLKTAADLAAATNISIPSARALLRCSTPVVDAVTLFRICDRTRFSGRYLVNGTLPADIRIAADPDEKRLLEIIRSLPDGKRETLYDKILSLIHELA